jgi:hypothetical protein
MSVLPPGLTPVGQPPTPLGYVGGPLPPGLTTYGGMPSAGGPPSYGGGPAGSASAAGQAAVPQRGPPQARFVPTNVLLCVRL